MKNFLPHPDSHLANSLSATGGTLYVLPLSVADLILCRTVHTVTVAASSHVQWLRPSQLIVFQWKCSRLLPLTVFPFLSFALIPEPCREGLCDTDVPFSLPQSLILYVLTNYGLCINSQVLQKETSL